MDEDTPVTQDLKARGIAHRTFRHAGPVHSLAQAAAERGQQPEQVIRSLVFRVARDEFVMVLAAGEAQVSWPRLRAHLGQSRLTLASEAEVRQATGYERGAVSPFGLARPLRILVDEAVLRPEEISIGSGVKGVTVLLSQASLRQALGQAEVTRLAE